VVHDTGMQLTRVREKLSLQDLYPPAPARIVPSAQERWGWARPGMLFVSISASQVPSVPLGSIPLSASSPSPVHGGQRHRREHFAAPYNLDAFCRWPAAPPPHAVAAIHMGFVVQASPQPMLGQSGRRNPPKRQVPAVRSPDLFLGSCNP